MGADFVSARLVITDGQKPDFKKGMKKVEQLKHTPIAEWPKEWRNNHDDETPLEAHDILLNDIRSLKRLWNKGSRGIDVFTVGKKRVVITGGFSWGDTPSEEFDMFVRLCEAGLTKEMGFDF